MEESLVLIKPDAVERNLIGRIISIYEGAGLKVKKAKMEKISIEKAKEHYLEHEGKDYFNYLINYITRSEILAVVLEGENAITHIRELNGSTKEPLEGTIRYKFAISGTENAVHASDCMESAQREIKLWFN
ncbi:MAG: nucleoside-diphosphate kinase [Sarcina sp.]